MLADESLKKDRLMRVLN